MLEGFFWCSRLFLGDMLGIEENEERHKGMGEDWQGKE